MVCERPAVEAANRIAPSFARIFKEMIIATDPARPLPRAAKGTIVRPQAVSLYAEDIEKLYVYLVCSEELLMGSAGTMWLRRARTRRASRRRRRGTRRRSRRGLRGSLRR